MEIDDVVANRRDCPVHRVTRRLRHFGHVDVGEEASLILGLREIPGRVVTGHLVCHSPCDVGDDAVGIREARGDVVRIDAAVEQLVVVVVVDQPAVLFVVVVRLAPRGAHDGRDLAIEDLGAEEAPGAHAVERRDVRTLGRVAAVVRALDDRLEDRLQIEVGLLEGGTDLPEERVLRFPGLESFLEVGSRRVGREQQRVVPGEALVDRVDGVDDEPRVAGDLLAEPLHRVLVVVGRHRRRRETRREHVGVARMPSLITLIVRVHRVRVGVEVFVVRVVPSAERPCDRIDDAMADRAVRRVHRRVVDRGDGARVDRALGDLEDVGGEEELVDAPRASAIAVRRRRLPAIEEDRSR